MMFGEVPVAQAEGAILAHGVPAAQMSKGTRLEAGHIAALVRAGVSRVTVARLEEGDVGEDAAAARLAAALVPEPVAQGLRVTPAATGRVNLIAHRAGLVTLDGAAITALNRVDPMLTLATLPDLKRVTAGVMIATIKVITYAVDGSALDRACEEARRAGLRVRPAALTTATLIETHHPGGRPAPKGRRVLDDRLDRLGCSLVETFDVAHERDVIAQAISRAKGAVVFLLTASATSDPRDTAPAAVRAHGGRVSCFGMPVDPGNLLFVGKTADHRPVIGLPGCARSPALNGADWVLERVICGLPVTADDISAMGVGGLLKEIPDRGRPRGDRNL